MATGITTSSNVSDFAAKQIAPILMIIEIGTITEQGMTPYDLKPGHGRIINIPRPVKLYAVAVQEGVVASQMQQLTSSNNPLTSGRILVQVVLTDEAKRSVQPDLLNQGFEAMSTAILRKVDEDHIADGQTFTATVGGTSTTPVPGYIDDAAGYIWNNPTEYQTDTVSAFLHGYAMRAVKRNLSGLTHQNTTPADSGRLQYPQSAESERMRSQSNKPGWSFNHGGVDVYNDPNISTTGNTQTGFVVSKRSWAHVRDGEVGRRELPQVGLPGASVLEMWKDYAHGVLIPSGGVAFLSAAVSGLN